MLKFYENHLDEYSEISENISKILKKSWKTVKKVQLSKLLKPKNVRKSLKPLKNNQKTESTKDLGQLYLDDLEKKQFLHKLKLDKKEREERMKNDLEAKSKKLSEEMEKAKVLEEQEKIRKKEEKAKRMIEKLEQIELEKKARLEEFEQSNLALKRVASVKPLFKEIEDRFVVNVELPELEQRKRELAIKRQVFAPMNVKEIISHEKQYEKHLEQMSSKRKNRIAENKKGDLINSNCQVFYKSKIFEIVQQSEKEKKEIQMQKEMNKKILTEKSKRYGEIVYELFKPTVPLNKSLDKTPFQQSPMKSIQKRMVFKKNIKIEEEKQVTPATRTKSTKAGLSRLKRIPSAEQKKINMSQDYLAEQRRKRQEHSSKAVRLKSWKDDIDPTLNPDQKLEKIRSQVQLLDSQTKSYEILTNVHNDLYHSQHLNQSYVEAIRAKLAYLNELTSL